MFDVDAKLHLGENDELIALEIAANGQSEAEFFCFKFPDEYKKRKRNARVSNGLIKLSVQSEGIMKLRVPHEHLNSVTKFLRERRRLEVRPFRRFGHAFIIIPKDVPEISETTVPLNAVR